jgi:hypothetical protein
MKLNAGNMNQRTAQIEMRRSTTLTVTCIICLVVIFLSIVLFVSNYVHYPDEGTQKQWFLLFILLQLPVIAGVVLLYFRKRVGLWIFLLGKILFFALPAIAGVDALGFLTPVLFLESAIFLILFGRQVRYMH